MVEEVRATRGTRVLVGPRAKTIKANWLPRMDFVTDRLSLQLHTTSYTYINHTHEFGRVVGVPR